MLKPYFSKELTEAGCDEAGRGCLAGPVFAAAVILPPGFRNSVLTDSKQLSVKQRLELRPLIEKEAVAWGVASASPAEIDEVNILNASITAMHRAVALLGIRPGLLLIDGNRFRPYPGIGHRCFVRGDSLYLSIAAASVLAKTYRDDYMDSLHESFPGYGWITNKGYPTAEHRKAVLELGTTIHHRASFHFSEQLTFAFD